MTGVRWKEAGINATDRPAPYAQYISTTYQGQFSGVAHSPRAIPYYVDYVYENVFMSPDGKRARINLSYINNPTLNQLVEKQRGQFAIAERKKTITEIESLMAEEQYYIFGSTDTRTYFWAPDIQNYRPTVWFPYTHVMKTWRDKA